MPAADWTSREKNPRSAFSCVQLNQSQSGAGALLELLSGKRRLRSFGRLALIHGGFRQSLELRHSYPQVRLAFFHAEISPAARGGGFWAAAGEKAGLCFCSHLDVAFLRIHADSLIQPCRCSAVEAAAEDPCGEDGF